MTITNFNYEGSYLPGLICNIVVKADLGRSAGRSTPPVLTSCSQEWQLADLLADLPLWYWHLVVKTGYWKICWQIYPQMHHGIYIMGMYLAAILDSSRKGGNFFYFSIIRLGNSQLALYSYVRCNPLDTPNTSKTPPKWQLQISTVRVYIC